MKVQVFIPCFVDQLFPETAVNMVNLLRRAGCDVHYNANQTCCGQPAFNSGFWDEAKEVSQKWVDDMNKYGYPIICPSSSCTGYVRNYIPDMNIIISENDNILNRTYEFSEYLVDVIGFYNFGAELNATAVYHDSCAALRECKIKKAPRKLLENVKGLKIVELKDADQCCGFGGTFSVKFEPISVAMAEKKVQNALSVGAEIIISADWSCLMQLQGYILKNKIPIKVMHIADLLVINN